MYTPYEKPPPNFLRRPTRVDISTERLDTNNVLWAFNTIQSSSWELVREMLVGLPSR